VSGKSHNQSDPVFPPANSPVRDLTEKEIQRLQDRLGRSVDRRFLVHWVSQAIRDVVRLAVQPTARECRDGLAQVAKAGRLWLHEVDVCPGMFLIGGGRR
jgi:hypothetical protein